jgi:mono/diheme cytochrome c family protein
MNRKKSSLPIGAVALIAAALIATSWSLSCASADDAASDQDKIDAGEIVYNTRCAVCHGDDLINTGQTFDLRKLKADERPRFEHSVLNGKNQMPPWKGVLSDADIDNLWHYIRAHAYEK